jgi:hypothetical protein
VPPGACVGAASPKRDAGYEKKQKTLMSPPSPTIEAMARMFPVAPEIKVFWFFSSEKNTFL